METIIKWIGKQSQIINFWKINSYNIFQSIKNIYLNYENWKVWNIEDNKNRILWYYAVKIK